MNLSKNHSIKFVFYFMVLILSVSCSKPTERADLIILNGKIFTGDERNMYTEALAVKNSFILKTGSKEDVLQLKSAGTTILDLKGSFAMPGFIEGHAHLLSLGNFKMQLDLTKDTSWKDIVEKVHQAAAEAQPGEWIEGRGWHVDKWDNKPENMIEGNPVHLLLSKVAPDHPVFLKHASGHSAIANQKAMDLAGISKSTPDPDGGTIIRFKDGSATGVFLENAQELISNTIDKSRKKNPYFSEIKKEAIQTAISECLQNGITSFQDAGTYFEDIDLIREMIQEGLIKMRLWIMVDGAQQDLYSHIKDYYILNEGNYLLTVRAVKEYVDGALGARGAWLLEPYSDMPDTEGLIATPLDELKQKAELAMENNFQFCIHAIGDRGNREILNLYQDVFKSHPSPKGLRWRIEHAQHLHPDDLPRFAEMGVIASMQPVHCTSDGPWVPRRLGSKRTAEGAYRWQDLLKSGAVVSSGTDAPVEPVDPIANFYAAVTRKMANGQTFYPGQKMSRIQALKSMTLNAAYAAFEEDIKGSLTEGKLADITILSQNLIEVPEEKIRETKILYTVLGGEVVYKNEAIANR